MIRIVISSGTADVINYKGKDGQPAQLRKQTAYAFCIQPDGSLPQFPDRFAFLLDREQAPYAAGEYTLHPSAVTVDRDGRLSCVPRLTPAPKR